MRRDNQPVQTQGEREADDPATAKQITVAMISRRKCGRRGVDKKMDDDDGDNNAQTQQSNSTQDMGGGDGGAGVGDDTDDDESLDGLDGVVAISLLSNADASGDEVVI
jgi:hypothetical protein